MGADQWEAIVWGRPQLSGGRAGKGDVSQGDDEKGGASGEGGISEESLGRIPAALRIALQEPTWALGAAAPHVPQALIHRGSSGCHRALDSHVHS